jgi:UDP-N-acetyl-D-mannosaminuronic acid dehydrogenase
MPFATNSDSHETVNRGVSVVGLGQIGLPLALLIARRRRVTGVDVDPDLVATLQGGDLPFSEPGLESLFESTRDQFEARTAVPADGHDTYVIVTPTPLEPETRVADLCHVREAAESIAEVISPGDLVVLESTVPPGTSTRVVLPILERGLDRSQFRFAHCPERALPGNTIEEMVQNHRVIGVLDAASSSAATDLYSFVEGEVHVTDPTTAEFVKLIENTYRDINVAAANEFATLAEQTGIDGREAIDLANEHPRVDILSPGPGVGGHCLPVDPQFLTQLNGQARMIAAAREINTSMAGHVLSLVRGLLGDAPDARVTMLGVAYKGGVGDTRETPANQFYQLARNEGYDIRATDPHVESYKHGLLEFDDAVADSDCLVLLTDHEEFADLSARAIGETMRRRTVVDTRGVLDRGPWIDAGFSVRTLGNGRAAGTPRDERGDLAKPVNELSTLD